MEPKIENKYTRNRAIMKEFYRYFFFFTPSSLVINILLGFFAIASIVPVILAPAESKSLYIYCLLVLVLALVFKVIAYYSNTKTFLKRDSETNGGQPSEVTTLLCEDALTQTTQNSEVRVELSDFKQVKKTKELVILKTKGNQCFMFKNDGYIKGSREELLEILKEKGFKIKK